MSVLPTVRHKKFLSVLFSIIYKKVVKVLTLLTVKCIYFGFIIAFIGLFQIIRNFYIQTVIEKYDKYVGLPTQRHGSICILFKTEKAFIKQFHNFSIS